MMGEPPDKPSPPVVGKVAHDIVELHWDQDVTIESENSQGGRRRYCIQEQEERQRKEFGNVYNGFSRSHVFRGLEPNNTYQYRVRVSNDFGDSPWSSVITVTTTKVPLIGRDIHRAILNWEIDKLEAFLNESEDSLVNVVDDLGMSPLMIASQKGYSSIVETLVEHGAQVNYSNASGKTSMMLACFGGHLSVASYLKDHGALLDPKDHGGSNALHWAIDGDKEDIVKWILECGANVDELDDSSWSPLMRLANLGGSAAVAKVLIEGGAQIDRPDKTGTTPLMAAAVNGNIEVCKLLVEKGAGLTLTNKYGRTPLEFAESFDRKDVVQFLKNTLEGKLPTTED
ncbi:fibronectin type 3 and ankyrin repeat domains protein 1-like [Actinia tenebrosa]|uniref:Fibronectin type 3 and ankyrin repeat domains protein 1-like n=1 Tax=Actinia tenebrosa TaxID=6105 RepID=A0A6P8HTQ7_ACTTE|nr:fibronectin type 3 and ankyrin repeat domains protein 1-like [Actinia tenebrosa]